MKRTKTITEFKVKQVIIDCEYNDFVDIKCGGTPILGYNFYVDYKKDGNKIEKFIRKMLVKYNQPCMNIRVCGAEWLHTKSVWTNKMIEECIKKGY